MRWIRPLILVAALSVVAVACSGDDPDSPAVKRSDSTEIPSVALYYQKIAAGEDLSKFGDVDIVVVARQDDEAAATDAIHEAGAKAYRYVQSYWFPSNREYDGFDIGANLDWAFCESGDEPRVGRQVGQIPWYFIDANEREARDQFVELLEDLRTAGYDGIMFDRGLAALTGADASRAGLWFKTSTCTDDPVNAGASLADAYVGLMSEVNAHGLELFQNYGYSPFHPAFPFRPDPADPACQSGEYTTCERIDDGFQHVDLFLNEAVAHPEATEWDNDYAANLAGERDPRFGGKVVGLITEGTLAGDVSREAVYFQFARVRIFDVPVAVFTGDDRCGGVESLCNRHGIYPELNSLRLGRPLTDEPSPSACTDATAGKCVWIRPYEEGFVAVNVTAMAKTVSVATSVEGCRQMFDQFSDALLEDGACLETIDLELPPYSGRPVSYRSP